MHENDCAQYDLCDSDVYSRDIINKFFVVAFFVCQVSGFVENFNIGIYSDTINVTDVKFYVMVLLIELYLFIHVPLSVTLTIFLGHNNVKQV